MAKRGGTENAGEDERVPLLGSTSGPNSSADPTRQLLNMPSNADSGRISIASVGSRLTSLNRAILRRAKFNLETHKENIFEEEELKRPSRWKLFKTRLPYYVPVFQWVPDYELHNFKYDFFAGLTVASMMVPQSLAYSSLAGIPANHVLSAAFSGLLVYSVFGTSRQLSIGPDAIICIMVGQQMTLFDEAVKLGAATTLAVLVAIISVVMGLLRLGFIDSILSRALLKGFVFAVATQIIIQQLPVLFGFTSHHAKGATVVDLIMFLYDNMHEFNAYTFAVAFPTVAFLWTLVKLKEHFTNIKWLKLFPGILLVVVVGTLLSWLFDIHAKYNVEILGDVPAGFVLPTAPLYDLPSIQKILPGASVLFLVGFVQSIAVCKIYANKYSYRMSANRELVAFGTTNMVASFMGQIPVFGSLSRSKVNDQAGATSQAAGAVCAVMILITMMFLTPFFHYLPRAVMSGIITVAAIGLLETNDINVMIRIRAFKDGAMLLLTYLCTVTMGLTAGIIVSTCISLLLVVQATTIPRFQIIGRVYDGRKTKFRPMEEFPEAESLRKEGLLVLRIEQSLYFANMGQMKDNLKRIELLGKLHVHPTEKTQLPPLRAVVFDLQSVEAMDASAVQILVEIVEQYHSRGIEVCFVKLRSGNVVPFTSSGLINMIGTDHLFTKMTDCIEFLLRRSKTSQLQGMLSGTSVNDTNPPAFVFTNEFEVDESSPSPIGTASATNVNNASTRTLTGTSERPERPPQFGPSQGGGALPPV